jgi:hypothetical protein
MFIIQSNSVLVDTGEDGPKVKLCSLKGKSDEDRMSILQACAGANELYYSMMVQKIPLQPNMEEANKVYVLDRACGIVKQSSAILQLEIQAQTKKAKGN